MHPFINFEINFATPTGYISPKSPDHSGDLTGYVHSDASPASIPSLRRVVVILRGKEVRKPKARRERGGIGGMEDVPCWGRKFYLEIGKGEPIQFCVSPQQIRPLFYRLFFMRYKLFISKLTIL